MSRSPSVMSFSPPSSHLRVSVNVLEAKNLLGVGGRNSCPDSFCKLKIGEEKFRSRIIKKSNNPRWMEHFEFYVAPSPPHLLRVSVWDWNGKFQPNTLIGRGEINLDSFDLGKENDLWVELKDGPFSKGSLRLSIMVNERIVSQETSSIHEIPEITVNGELSSRNSAVSVADDSGVVGDDSTSLASSDNIPSDNRTRIHSAQPLGYLKIGLKRLVNVPPSNSDAKGKSVFCVMQLGFSKFQTHLIDRDGPLEWNCDYQFEVTDVHSLLEISVLERDSKGRTSVIGARVFPVLFVENGGLHAWRLRDRSLKKKLPCALVMDVNLQYDLLKAVVRTVRPKDEVSSEYLSEMRAADLVRKVGKMRKMVTLVSASFDLISFVLNWREPIVSYISYFLFVFLVIFFQPYWVPAFLLAIFAFCYYDTHLRTASDEPELEDDSEMLVSSGSFSTAPSVSSSARSVPLRSIENLIALIPAKATDGARRVLREIQRSPSPNSLVGNVRSAHDQAAFVQGCLEFLAEHFEKVINTFTFSSPWLSFLAAGFLGILLMVMYILPFRVVVFLWGTYEFAKGLLGSYNCDLVAFLSRVPSRHEARLYGAPA